MMSEKSPKDADWVIKARNSSVQILRHTILNDNKSALRISSKRPSIHIKTSEWCSNVNQHINHIKTRRTHTSVALKADPTLPVCLWEGDKEVCDWLFVRACVFIIANWRLITVGDGSERVKPGRTDAEEIERIQTERRNTLLLRDRNTAGL